MQTHDRGEIIQSVLIWTARHLSGTTASPPNGRNEPQLNSPFFPPPRRTVSPPFLAEVPSRRFSRIAHELSLVLRGGLVVPMVLVDAEAAVFCSLSSAIKIPQVRSNNIYGAWKCWHAIFFQASLLIRSFALPAAYNQFKQLLQSIGSMIFNYSTHLLAFAVL